MLTKFDWLRLCRSGTELLATLRHLMEEPEAVPPTTGQGAPFSATQGPCLRCRVYAPQITPDKDGRYCSFCREIKARVQRLSFRSLQSMIIWGYVNQVPRKIREIRLSRYVYGAYIHDEQHFLLAIHRRYLKDWLQELVLYHGIDLKGLIQIFPTVGKFQRLNMGDYLTWAIHHEAIFLHNQLWVRFFATAQYLVNPKALEQKGLLTFNVSEFLRLLEMAEVFRTYLRPQEQEDLHKLLQLNDPKEEQFYWGRFLGQLSQETKDMLNAWKIRQWPKNQIQLLYLLIQYVFLPKST